uniref:Regulatory protein RecX n=1 Tax=Anthurium amnicola TaxID=1678845 RepID=A0A1D1YBJ6_9ARAE
MPVALEGKMASFAVNRGMQFSTGFRCRALLASRAKREFKLSGSLVCTARRGSESDEALNFALLDSHRKKASILSGSGVSNYGRGGRSFVSFTRGFSVRSCGDGSLYEMSSFATEPECGDVVFNDIEEFLEIGDSTGSELYHMECELIEEAELSLDKHEEMSENALSRKDKTQFNNVKENAEKMAIELLATRSFTTVELGKKLHGKKYPSDVIDLVILELKSRGLLNDGLFAESFSQSRWISSSWGPRRIKKALLQKGVNEADIDKATNLVFKDGNMCTGQRDTYFGMSKISMDRLFAQASKQWLRGQNTSLVNRRSRMVRWLQYRGFDWGITNFILKKLESKYPP